MFEQKFGTPSIQFFIIEWYINEIAYKMCFQLWTMGIFTQVLLINGKPKFL